MSMGIVAGIVTVVGAGVSYMGQRSAAKTASGNAAYGAQLRENEAIQEEREAREQIRRDRMAARKVKGQQRAAIASSGVAMTGSPLEASVETAGALELAALESSRKASMAESRGFAEAGRIRQAGASQARQLKAGANQSLIGGLASAGFSYASVRG